MTTTNEATLRRDLAAAYRLAAMFGWDDTLYTHFSARLPGEEPRFLINPFGLFFEEVKASDLIIVDMHGRVIEGKADYNVAGFTIHSAVHMAREDAHCVIHTHTLAGMAVAAADKGLLQLNQINAEFHQRVGYHTYEGIALDLGERERLVASLDNNIALILRHHGLLSVGASVADAFYVMYYLNKACEIQLSAAALQGVSEMPEALSRHACEQFQGAEGQRQLLWEAWLRKLDRECPDYKN
ncbi:MULTISPECIES: class II aldolase/adducin family protein [Pseudomonas]|jgi:ribulose-5-phosphate 4-epimerase/fuculose-1-phosphate aldolase|uniref:Putative aldolase class 2 protein CC_1201 n=1 Tax=Pseudomonas marincola TaxID=437900 RepID=A0A653E8U6_9PSED|nr:MULTISPECIES: class II aldolase/adducin family protein [Pseudomonas]MAB97266.1 class II aldolase [Pseudomonadaceae bacterium]MBQ54111.1 class II aldolase [Pseudomonadaceae bacterium]CAE6909893.1 Putative aldolase class 2 protein CC_1201 [Pseudomonas marincola]HCP53576.1 class II aldolase [Pseudomonas sp.]